MLPENATVRDCLQKYYEMKVQEIDDVGKNIKKAFLQKLQTLEDELVGDSMHVNSEAVLDNERVLMAPPHEVTS